MSRATKTSRCSSKGGASYPGEASQTRFRSRPRPSTCTRTSPPTEGCRVSRRRKRVSFDKQAGTCSRSARSLRLSSLTTVENLRNHIIHNGLRDDMPKVHEVIANGVPIEKYLPMPDMLNGRFERFRNRNLFYGREDEDQSSSACDGQRVPVVAIGDT